MTQWRPQPTVRVVAIGLHWREGRLLAAEVRDDAGHLKGVRPLGGGVQFGESWQAALAREFKEELGLSITLEGAPFVMENIYRHESATGHEVIFISDVKFVGEAFADRDCITFREDNGAAAVARWYDVAGLDRDGCPELYPSGLKSLLLDSRAARQPTVRTRIS